MVEPYTWMVEEEYSAIEEKLQWMSQLQEALDKLPQTALTFRPQSRREVDTKLENIQFLSQVLECYGFWKMPVRHAANQKIAKFINPEHNDAQLYSDVVVECECGSKIIHEHGRHVDMDGINSHSEQCRVEWERDAQARLWERRREVIQQSGRKLVPLSVCAKRLGVSERAAVYRLCEELDISYEDLKSEGTRMREATFKYLRDRGFTNRTIGDAFGVAPNTVSGAVNRFEDRDIAYAGGD